MSTQRPVGPTIRRWVVGVLGVNATFEPLPGGQTGSISLVRTGTERYLLRSVSPVAWGVEASRQIESERLGCTLLADRAVAVPRLVAVDVDGRFAGVPSSLSTWLPGAIRLDRLGAAALRALAEAAVVVHATRVPDELRPRPYALWTPGRVKVPDFASRPQLWSRAIELFDGGPPPTPYGLLHRDFHPGNVLWTGDRVTGLVDWAETAWGPADLDVAHCCTNLALLDGIGAAVAFRDAYLTAGGRLEQDPRAAAHWTLADLFGFLPDPTRHLGALLRHHHVAPAELARRMEQLLEVTLGDLSP